MLIILGTLRLPAENLNDARGAMREMIEQSQEEEGCIAYSYAEDVIEPGLIHVQEMWRDQEALDAHLESEHLQEWRANWDRLGIYGRDLRQFEAEGGQKL